MGNLLRDGLPFADQMVSGTPCQSLDGQGWISRTACPHYRSAKNAKVGGFVREPPAVHDVGFRVIAHARTAISMSAEPYGDLG
jgi:hypothetical protein